MVDGLSRNGVDPFEGVEVLEDNCHVKVFNTKRHSLEMHSLDVFKINYEEWELRDGNQAELRRSYFNDGLKWASLEVEILIRNIELNRVVGLIGLLLDLFSEVVEFSRKLLLRFSFSLFLLKLIQVVSSSASSHVNIISNDT